MCGRYYYDYDIASEIEELAEEIEQRILRQRQGDIHPSDTAPVLTGREGRIGAGLMKWGFPQYRGNGLLINARAETVLQRRMFRDSVLARRCIIPAKHFYEWDASKDKVTFSSGDGSALFFAGFYQCFDEQKHFIILTTQANESVRSVHERMPLILQKNELQDWLSDSHFFEAALCKTPDSLKQYREYEQQSLFLTEYERTEK